MKSVFVIDDNGKGMEELRAFLREQGYSATESGPDCRDTLRFNQFAIDRACVQIFWLTQDLRIIYANGSACQALGYTLEELTRMSVSDIDPSYPKPEDPEISERWRALKASGYARFETCHKARNGHIYPVEIQSNFLEFEGMEYSCCFVTDISDRKKTEEKLLLQQLCIEKADTIFLQLSAEGKILMANECACRSLGYSADELLALSDVDIAPNATDEGRECLTAFDLDGCLAGETILQRKDGTKFPIAFSASKQEFHGKTYFFGFAKDITKRKKTELALRESEEKFRLLTENSPNAIVLIQGEHIVYVNPAVTETYGFRREELIGTEFWKFIHEDFRDMAKKRGLERQHGEELASRHEYRVITRNGEDRWVMASSVSLEYEGSPAMIVTLVDITERKRAEEERKNLEAQLHQAQKMEAIGQLAGGIAHDFNNILTAIMGFAETIAMRTNDDNPLQHHAYQILTAVERAASLTNGLLAFGRKQILRKSVFEVHEIVYGIKKMLQRLIPEDIDFRTKNAAPGMTVMADKGQIEQVLMNLVTNARDAMPTGGALTIDAEPAFVNEDACRVHGIKAPGMYARINVQDTGCGMDEDTLKKVFEPFFTTKQAGKGTGLGLSIIYGIVKQHNGFITADSSPGQGTAFHVYLPLADQKTEGLPEKQRHEPAPRGTETILLAEDDDTIRELNRTLLVESGYSVIDAVDGQDALEKLATSRSCVDMLITDVIMPNKDGKTLSDEIMKVRPDVKVLFMSGYPTDILDSRGISIDSINFLKKPFMPSEFLRRLREILDNGT